MAVDDVLQRISIVVGDITQLRVDGIVNAANSSLLGGGGVDGAIHRAAGPALLEHNRSLQGCPTGSAVLTPSFNLQSRGILAIIHTVGPVWQGDGQVIGQRETEKLGDRMEDVLLASCYHRSLEIAAGQQLRSLAFPCISTGVYKFPRLRAARIALGHVIGFLSAHPLPEQVLFCCFAQEDAAIYREALDTRSQWLYSRRRG